MNKEILGHIYSERKNLIVSGDIATNKTDGVVFDIVDNIVEKGENFLVTDAKEEYLERYYQTLKENGYNIVTINLRNPEKSEGWNPLEHAYDLYKQNKNDQATQFLEIISHNIFTSTNEVDPFWENMASNLFSGIILGIFDDAKKEEVNLASVNKILNYFNYSYGSNDYFSEYFKYKKPTDLMYTYVSPIAFAPKDTKDSIVTVTKQKITSLLVNKSIERLTNETTYNLDDLLTKKTAIFFINRDENTCLNYLASIFVSQLYYSLINKKVDNFNFILDNFDSLGTIDKFNDMLSSCIDRNIKFLIVTRSDDKLYGDYGIYLKKLANKIVVDKNKLNISFDNQTIILDNILKAKVQKKFDYPTLKTEPIKTFDIRKFVLEQKKDIFNEININDEKDSFDELITKIDEKLKELDKHSM